MQADDGSDNPMAAHIDAGTCADAERPARLQATEGGRAFGEPTVTIAADGRRVVRSKATDQQGRTFIIEHDFPDAIRHHYWPAGVGEELLLYDGPFEVYLILCNSFGFCSDRIGGLPAC